MILGRPEPTLRTSPEGRRLVLVSPATQLRTHLERARELGADWEEAWPWANAMLLTPHDTTHRREWRAILAEHADQWRAAYQCEPAPRRLAALADLALDDLGQPLDSSPGVG